MAVLIKIYVTKKITSSVVTLQVQSLPVSVFILVCNVLKDITLIAATSF